MSKLPITVIIPVRNEEKNLPQLLPLLGDFDEVIVVDSQSTDRTPEIVAEFGYKFVQFVWNGHFPKKRNWTLRNVAIKNDWVFFLDADEFITPEFMLDLKMVFKDTKDYEGFWIFYNNFFMGKRLTHGDTMRKLALFRKSVGEYEKIDAADDDKNWGYSGIEIHEQPILKGKVGKINGRLDHRENKGLSWYIQKHNEYSSWEAKRFLKTSKSADRTSFRQKLKYVLIDSWLFCKLYYILCYYVKLGFLDGKEGYMFCKLKEQYFFNVKSKIEELRREGYNPQSK